MRDYVEIHVAPHDGKPERMHFLVQDLETGLREWLVEDDRGVVRVRRACAVIGFSLCVVPSGL